MSTNLWLFQSKCHKINKFCVLNNCKLDKHVRASLRYSRGSTNRTFFQPERYFQTNAAYNSKYTVCNRNIYIPWYKHINWTSMKNWTGNFHIIFSYMESNSNNCVDISKIPGCNPNNQNIRYKKTNCYCQKMPSLRYVPWTILSTRNKLLLRHIVW